MEKPKILLSGTNTPDPYVAAVEKAGGIPDYQYCPVYSDVYDGLLLTGGADIHPFHANTNHSTDHVMKNHAERANYAPIRTCLSAIGIIGTNRAGHASVRMKGRDRLWGRYGNLSVKSSGSCVKAMT